MTDDDSANDVLADQINLVVGNVRDALKQAGAQSPGVTVTAVDLSLTSVMTQALGLDLKFKLFGHDVGIVLGGTRVSTQTIDVTLTPPKPVQSMVAPDLTDRLAMAITTVSAAMASASSNSPDFVASQATVEIDFELDAEGSIDFMVTGDDKKSATQKVTLTLTADS